MKISLSRFLNGANWTGTPGWMVMAALFVVSLLTSEPLPNGQYRDGPLAIGNPGMIGIPSLWSTFSGGVEEELTSENTGSVAGEQRETKERIQLVGAVAATLISLLFVAFGYFKLNQLTRDIYSRRLMTIALFVGALILLIGFYFILPLLAPDV